MPSPHAKRVGIVLQDKDGLIISCNEEAEDILGLQRQDMLYLTAEDPRWAATDIQGRFLPGHRHPGMRSLLSGKPLHDFIMSISKGFGQAVVWLKVDAQPIFSRSGKIKKPNGVLTLFEEIEPPRAILKDKAVPTIKTPQSQKQFQNKAIKKAEMEAVKSRQLSTVLSTYLINLGSQWTAGFTSHDKIGSLGYETFLLLMQCYSINPRCPIPMKHILHGGQYSARRVSDFLKVLVTEGYIEITKQDRHGHSSRESYIEVTAKLRRIFIQVTLDIERLVNQKEGGGG